MDSQKAVTQYDVFIGQVDRGSLAHPLRAGFSTHAEGDTYYTLRLSMFPTITYYVSKNESSHDRYTVYTKRVEDSETGAVRFQNPVGSGRLSTELKSYLEVRFPLLSARLFMSLYPRS